jgi:hypothetical protein
MGNFISSITQGNSSPLSWMHVLILGLIPLGQLWARVFKFKGSLDKWWLMFPLLQFPPFSFIPLLMMKFGFVKDGEGSDPVDKIMILPIIAKFIIPFILPFIVDEDSTMLYTIVGFVLQLLMTMVANMTRRYTNCNGITMDSLGKAGIDSTISMAMGDVTAFAIGFLPFIGIVVSILEMIPVIGDFVNSILWSVGFAGTYIVINMFNQHPNMQKFCSTPFTGNLQDKIPFIVSLIILIGINAFNAFSPV